MRRLSVGLGLVLAACATAPAHRSGSSIPGLSAPSPLQREVLVAGLTETISMPPDQALQRADQQLRSRGLLIVAPAGPGGRLEARGRVSISDGLADCPRIVTTDPSAEAFRSRRASATEVTASVTTVAEPAPDNSSKVTIRANFVGTYMNNFTYTEQQGGCRSTGALERQLMDEIRGS